MRFQERLGDRSCQASFCPSGDGRVHRFVACPSLPYVSHNSTGPGGGQACAAPARSLGVSLRAQNRVAARTVSAGIFYGFSPIPGPFNDSLIALQDRRAVFLHTTHGGTKNYPRSNIGTVSRIRNEPRRMLWMVSVWTCHGLLPGLGRAEFTIRLFFITKEKI